MNARTRPVACVRCGVRVQGNARRKYCSVACRVRAWEERCCPPGPRRFCPRCGKER